MRSDSDSELSPSDSEEGEGEKSEEEEKEKEMAKQTLRTPSKAKQSAALYKTPAKKTRKLPEAPANEVGPPGTPLFTSMVTVTLFVYYITFIVITFIYLPYRKTKRYKVLDKNEIVHC